MKPNIYWAFNISTSATTLKLKYPNKTGDGNLHRLRAQNLRELLEDYECVK